MTSSSFSPDSLSTPSPKNDNGVYVEYQTQIIARKGRSYAEVNIARCDDGHFRFSTGLLYSYGGFGGPIVDDGDGLPTYQLAKAAGIAELLRRFPKPFSSEPRSVHDELRELREQIERQSAQPSLF